MDEWDSLSVNLAFWDMCEYLYRQFSTVWFGPVVPVGSLESVGMLPFENLD